MQKNIWTVEEQINKLLSGCEKDQVEDLTELKDEIQKITENIQVWISDGENIRAWVGILHRLRLFLPKVTNMELTMFQRNLEEEVKRDHKEKKDNQELLKSLKMEKEQFIKEQQRYERLRSFKLGSFDAFSPRISLAFCWGLEAPTGTDQYCTCKGRLSSSPLSAGADMKTGKNDTTLISFLLLPHFPSAVLTEN